VDARLQQSHGLITIGVSFSGSWLAWSLWILNANASQRRNDGAGLKSCVNCFTGASRLLCLSRREAESPIRRYERELQGGIRPPLRLIAAQDVPASCPMVLCISGITWSEEGLTDDGMPIVPHPELEVTDGWYRLRAQVDKPLARATRRGVLRIGRKIRVVGARVRFVIIWPCILV
jgi:hypothetical protein